MKKLFPLPIVLIILLFSCNNSHQNSIIQHSTLTAQDSILLQTLIDSLNTNYIDDNDKLIILSDQIVTRFPNHTEMACIEIAHIHFYKENYVLAEYYFAVAANIYLKNTMMVEYAEQLSNIGVVREVSGSYPAAIEKYLEALEIFESLDMKFRMSRIFNNIGIVYQQLGESDKSLEYYQKSLSISQDAENDTYNSASCLNNIATHFEEFVHDYDSALYYYEKALLLYEDQGLVRQQLVVNSNIGNVYLLKNELDIADSIFNYVLNKSIEQGFEKAIAPILSYQAELYYRQGKYNAAEKKSVQASDLAIENSNKEIVLDCLVMLYKIYEKQRNYKKANEILREKYKIKEELSGIEQKKQINLLSAKYEVDKRENKIEILELNNAVQKRAIFQLYLIIASIILLFAGAFMTFILYRKNNKLKNTQMQADILRYIDRINQIEEENKTKITAQKENRELHVKEIVNLFNLTDREGDVLLLISNGYNNSKIAEKLFVSVNTVKFHTKNIFVKLDVKNRIEALQKTQIL